MPPRVLLNNLVRIALILTAALIALQLDRFWPFALPSGLRVLFWPLLALGLFFILSAEVTFIRIGHATGAAEHAPDRLVTAGIFAWTRNPIYIGADCVLLGTSFFTRSPTLLTIALLFIPAVHVFVTRMEEPRIAQRFGQEYVVYKQRVPRWFPRRPR